MRRRKKNDEPAEESTNWADWPENDSGTTRKLYVAGTTKAQRALLRNKGYEPVDVLHLPRLTETDHREALEGWLMGMAEGSIEPDPEKRKTIELEMRERGLLIHKTVRVEAKIDDKETLEKLLSFGQTRFTVNRATRERINTAQERAISPPKGDEDKVH